jgi:hypothetical protein
MGRWVPESFSAKIKAGPRTYFIDLEGRKTGSKRLVISESIRVGESKFERHRVVVTADFIERFVAAIHDVLSRAGNSAASSEPTTRKDENPRASTTFAEIRQSHPKAYLPWTQEEDGKLREAFGSCNDIDVLADTFGRKPGAIESRLRKLGLRE